MQQEISGLQGQINEEIDRQLRNADELPAKILGEIADTGRNGEHGQFSGGRMGEVERAEANANE